ncbi:hypothetical protein THASP1DRAFT_32684 [Thamnocephalis sphaerospora]|uniref:Ricin B lectin domain-containing protein n=1 Tax=Thamnocephalis sphaerospora TaxID=78915 RepID=A0A4P9XIG0_9FUNG|nr:hypothetical protein THASP1DRAFT_32684 [Thamnocephalis sphaerospora]|eukprot:RKP05478.1 hypothetical protein THASP1DRAFT_32684 [Thamnocephalis sphaerospora]
MRTSSPLLFIATIAVATAGGVFAQENPYRIVSASGGCQRAIGDSVLSQGCPLDASGSDTSAWNIEFGSNDSEDRPCYTICNASTSKCITNDNGAIRLKASNGQDNQLWCRDSNKGAIKWLVKGEDGEKQTCLTVGSIASPVISGSSCDASNSQQAFTIYDSTKAPSEWNVSGSVQKIICFDRQDNKCISFDNSGW